MITPSPIECQTENVTVETCGLEGSWQAELARSNLSVEALLEQVGLHGGEREQFLLSHQVPPQFPVRATPGYIRRIRPGDPNDPLLLQVIPRLDELVEHPGYTDDPLDEQSSNAIPGIVHKYRNRALLIVTGACAIHCRYCFRRHFPYQDNTGSHNLDAALDYLRQRSSIREVILSGGDPLSASDRYLGRLVEQLASIGHISRLRIHTRLPVVLPGRVTPALLNWLARWPGQKVLVIHCNHPRELTDEVGLALGALAGAGATLLNQSVLLRDINDDPETLAELSERLFKYGVIPYYLHQLDAVAGAHHFAVSDARAAEIANEVSAHLPGFLVPRLVREIPGELAKLPVRGCTG